MSNSLPESAVPASTSWWGAGVAGLVFAVIVGARLPAGPSLALLIGAAAIVMWWLEWRRHRPHAPLPPAAKRGMRRRGIIAVAVLYVCATAMHLTLGGDRTASIHEVLLPFACLGMLALLVAGWVGRGRQDGFYHLGEAIAGVWDKQRRQDWMLTVMGGWLIKAFFLPLMLAWSYTWLAQLHQAVPSLSNPYALFTVLMAMFYAVDTAFAVVGYLSSSSVIGAQIRSVDRTWLGCLSAMICYPPLNNLVAGGLLNYHDGVLWKDWLAGYSYVAAAWGLAILALTFVYMWATIAFGPRFSNLTHRGIITTGPYRWSKHPAYICKNLSWWLISMPFLSRAGIWEAVCCCLALLGINFIYWLRAVTEERHLRHDPVYRQYEAWIRQHGIFGRLRGHRRHE